MSRRKVRPRSHLPVISTQLRVTRGAMTVPLRLQSLGFLRLCGPGGELLAHRRKELAVLVILADRSPRAVRREELIALFWGERSEERARHSLRQVVLRLRRACGEIIA